MLAFALFVLGVALGLTDDGAFMASADAMTKGKIARAVLWYLVFFAATQGGVLFLLAGEWSGVAGCMVGGAIGVAVVTNRNKGKDNGRRIQD